MPSKLLLFIADSSQTGAPVQVELLAKTLKSKMELACLCPEGWLQGSLSTAGVRVFTLPGNGRLAQVKSLQRAVLDYSPTVVNAHGVRAGIIAGRTLSRRFKTRLIYTEHLWTADYYLKNPLRQFMQLRLLRQTARVCEKVVAVSQTTADFLVVKKIVPAEKCQVIYNAVGQMKPVTPVSEPVIGTIGSLNKMKGTRLILLAAHQLKTKYPHLRVKIMGDGPERPTLEKLARQLDLNVKFLGMGRSETLQPFLETLRIYIQPSYSESFGLAPLGAMSAGLPVIVSRAGALSELIEDKETGLIFERGNVTELSEKISELITNPQIFEKIRLNGQAHSKEFSLSRMAEAYLKVYQNN
jgi:glycosyltransferase involved in cell wall biosynthesis